jgi:hypothetical protein
LVALRLGNSPAVSSWQDGESADHVANRSQEPTNGVSVARPGPIDVAARPDRTTLRNPATKSVLAGR